MGGVVATAGNAMVFDPLPPVVTGSRLVLAVAAVLAGATVLFGVLGLVFNLLLIAVAVPFGVAAYLLWLHATGRLHARARRRVTEPPPWERGRAPGWSPGGGPAGFDDLGGRSVTNDRLSTMGRREALDALGLPRDADQRAIRRAYRKRVKAVHPDTTGGDEAAFRRVRAAYETLSRGKG